MDNWLERKQRREWEWEGVEENSIFGYSREGGSKKCGYPSIGNEVCGI